MVKANNSSQSPTCAELGGNTSLPTNTEVPKYGPKLAFSVKQWIWHGQVIPVIEYIHILQVHFINLDTNIPE